MSDGTTESRQSAQRDELYVAMDYFGGDWTPIAVLSDPEEAAELKEMLSADAEATVEAASYYDSCEVARSGAATSPIGIDEVTVAFTEEGSVLGVGSEDLVRRELCIKNDGGLRHTYHVYETAEAVAEDKPSVTGQFISSELTAEDVMGEIQ